MPCEPLDRLTRARRATGDMMSCIFWRLPHAAIQVVNFRFPVDMTETNVFCETDQQGRFRCPIAPVQPGRGITVHAYGAENSPCLWKETAFTWPKESMRAALEVEIKLPRGVLIRGRLLEQPGNRPVPGAAVYYTASRDDSKSEFASFDVGDLKAFSDAEGNFSIAVPPGTGELAVLTGSIDQVLEECTVRFARWSYRYRSCFFAHLPLDVPADAQEKSVELILHRGVTIRGEVVGADGKVPKQLELLRRQPDGYGGYTDIYQRGRPHWQVLSGNLIIQGVPPEGEFPIALLDPIAMQGKRLTVHGSDTEQPLHVELEKCGSATLRFVDAEGKPLAGFAPDFLIQFERESEAMLAAAPADYVQPSNEQLRYFDSRNAASLVSDNDGRLNLSALIPGMIYKVRIGDPLNGASFATQICVKPGEHVDMPDIVIKKPFTPRVVAPAAKAKADDLPTK